jgi:hypothetical protein
MTRIGKYFVTKVFPEATLNDVLGIPEEPPPPHQDEEEAPAREAPPEDAPPPEDAAPPEDAPPPAPGQVAEEEDGTDEVTALDGTVLPEEEEEAPDLEGGSDIHLTDSS